MSKIKQGNRAKQQNKKTAKRNSAHKRLNISLKKIQYKKVLPVVTVMLLVVIMLLFAIPVTEPGVFSDKEIIWSSKESSYIDKAVELDDGTLVALAVAKTKNSDNSNDYFYYLIKVDQEGDLLWQKELSNQKPADLIKSNNDDGVIIVGSKSATRQYYGRSGFPVSEAMIAKYDSSGNIVWENSRNVVDNITDKTLMDAAIDMASLQFASVSNSGSGYVATGICAFKSSVSSYRVSNCLAKVDENGNNLWEKEQDLGIGSFFLLLYQATTSTGNIVISSFNKIVYLDGSGEILWNKENYDISSNIAISGERVIFKDENALIQLDKNGNEEWRHDCDLAQPSAQVIVLADSNIILVNSKRMMGVNSSGEQQWVRDFNGEDSIYSGTALKDGRFIIWGSRDNNNKGIIKFSDYRRNVFGLKSWIQ